MDDDEKIDKIIEILEKILEQQEAAVEILRDMETDLTTISADTGNIVINTEQAPE